MLLTKDFAAKHVEGTQTLNPVKDESGDEQGRVAEALVISPVYLNKHHYYVEVYARPL